MKIYKFSIIALLSVIFLGAATPSLTAKQSRHSKHHHSSRSTNWSFNFNIDPFPRVVQYNYAPQPVYRQEVTVIRPYVEQHVYYPAYQQQVYVPQPYSNRVYVEQNYSYWNY